MPLVKQRGVRNFNPNQNNTQLYSIEEEGEKEEEEEEEEEEEGETYVRVSYVNNDMQPDAIIKITKETDTELIGILMNTTVKNNWKALPITRTIKKSDPDITRAVIKMPKQLSGGKSIKKTPKKHQKTPKNHHKPPKNHQKTTKNHQTPHLNNRNIFRMFSRLFHFPRFSNGFDDSHLFRMFPQPTVHRIFNN